MSRKAKASNPGVTYRFGIRASDIHEAARLVRPLLKIRWKCLNDAFWGGEHYLQMRKNGIIIKLHHNYEAFFDHWLQPAYQDYPILLLMQYPAGVKAPQEADLMSQLSTVVDIVVIPPNADAWEQSPGKRMEKAQ